MRIRGNIIVALLLFGVCWGKAQSISDATQKHNQFVQYFTNGQEGAAYSSLYASCDAYLKVLDNPSLTAQHKQAKDALKDLYAYLEKGAYYYANQNNNQQTLLMAQAYTSVATHPQMQDVALVRSGNNYMSIVKLAAFNTFNTRDYAKAIPYLKAYLSTGDLVDREKAYEGLGKAYYNLKDYRQSINYLAQGIQLYPNSRSMIYAIVNSCGKADDDAALQQYLPKAIALSQGDTKRLPTLLNNLGASYERSGDFEKAVSTFQQLRSMRPSDLNTARNLALNAYNAGAKNMNASYQAGSKNDSRRYKESAEYYFRQAEPIFNQLMQNDPFNVVKYATALANIYSCTEETSKFQAINSKLMSIGYSPVSAGGNNMSLMSMNDAVPTPQPVVQPTPVPQPVVPQPIPKSVPTATDIDVDINIAQTHTNNSNTYAVIIANENYTKAVPVPMANNDGKIFAEYCRKVLGLPARNVREHYDLTALDMEDAMDDIKIIARACKGNLNVIFYYAGHGIPDEGSKDAYLLPVDGRGDRTTGCMSLKELYEELESLKANCVTVFLDACFSGGARGGDMIASARGVAMKAKPVEANGNMIIFSAVSGTETALPYKEQKHGLFTYYLLKKLRESGGDVTLGELGDYLSREVALQAQLVNKKPQTPTVTPSLSLGDRWKSFKLIK